MLEEAITQAKFRYFDFLTACKLDETKHCLTTNAEPTAFATCFWIFGLHLLKRNDLLLGEREALIDCLKINVRKHRRYLSKSEAVRDKPYKQLLCFTLSALAILDTLSSDPLADLVTEQIPEDIKNFLNEMGCLNGVAQSGNHALFLGVFLIHCKENLGVDCQAQIDQWVTCHLNSMNRFGFGALET